MTHDVSKVNEFFQKMATICREFVEAQAVRNAEKKVILAADKVDDVALDAWWKREEQIKYPYSTGQMKAYWAWKESVDGEPICDDLPSKGDMPDFSNTLIAAGVTSMIVSDQSTALLGSLHLLADLGWAFDELWAHTVTNRWGEQVTRQGIRLRLK